MKKLFIFLSYLVVLVAGFGLRTLLERAGVSFGKVDQKILNQQVEPVSGQDQFVTYVNFENGKFSDELVKIHKGDYLAITNTDKDNLMWLNATMSAWTTVRGYGESERVMKTIDEVGVYRIGERTSGDVLVVEVYQ